jgi:hypothetical protein
MEPGVVILWVVTGFSAFFVGLMIVCLFIVHTMMALTNYRTLDGMKTGRMCPMPFVSTNNDPEFVKDHLFSSTCTIADRFKISNKSLEITGFCGFFRLGDRYKMIFSPRRCPRSQISSN